MLHGQIFMAVRDFLLFRAHFRPLFEMVVYAFATRLADWTVDVIALGELPSMF